MNVLLINVGWEQLDYVRRLKRAGHSVFAVSSSPQLISEEDVEKLLLADCRDIESILSFARECSVDAVVSDQCDYSMFAQSYVSEALGLPGPKLPQAILCTNKYFQRTHLEKFEVLQPHFSRADSVLTIEEFANKHGFPIVVKPADSRGSFGVSVVNSKNEIRDAYLAAIKHSFARQVIVEQFIDGVEYTVDGYCFNGCPRSLAVGKKNKFSHRSQVASAIIYNSDESSIESRLKEKNDAVAKYLGLDFGFIHAEYIVSSDGAIYLVEMANRGGGCWTSTVVDSLATGLDLPEFLIKDCIGSSYVTPIEAEHNKVDLRFFSINGTGVLKDVKGWDVACAIPGVKAARLNIDPGIKISEVTDDAARHGFVILSDANGNNDAIFKQFNSCLEFVIV